jgi:hypothetical protein
VGAESSSAARSGSPTRLRRASDDRGALLTSLRRSSPTSRAPRCGASNPPLIRSSGRARRSGKSRGGGSSAGPRGPLTRAARAEAEKIGARSRANVSHREGVRAPRATGGPSAPVGEACAADPTAAIVPADAREGAFWRRLGRRTVGAREERDCEDASSADVGCRRWWR